MHHLVDVGEAESESLDVVAIARRDAIEFVEDLFQVLLADAYAVVGNGDFDAIVSDVARRDGEKQGCFLASIFDSVVKEIENHVGEMHLVDMNNAVFGVEIGSDSAAVFLDFDFECRLLWSNHPP